MNLREVLNFRRAIRVYEQKNIDADKVKECLQLATLSPTSDNMQLYEFYHITDQKMMKKIAYTCLDQTSATTANQFVVFVARQDLYRKRSKSILDFERENIKRNSPKEKWEKRIKKKEVHYQKILRLLYSRFFGLIGLFRVLLSKVIGLFRPIIRQVSENDMRVVVHRSTALVAQTFMIAMASEGYDTCPLEGFDSKRVKKTLQLPYRTEVSIIISCGIRDAEKGVSGERYRVPFQEVYHKM